MPSADQRRCRSYTVFHFPNRDGRSRHGIPVRWRKRMPLITLRWFLHRPPRPMFRGRCGFNRAHSALDRSPRPMKDGTTRTPSSHQTRRTLPSHRSARGSAADRGGGLPAQGQLVEPCAEGLRESGCSVGDQDVVDETALSADRVGSEQRAAAGVDDARFTAAAAGQKQPSPGVHLQPDRLTPESFVERLALPRRQVHPVDAAVGERPEVGVGRGADGDSLRPSAVGDGELGGSGSGSARGGPRGTAGQGCRSESDAHAQKLPACERTGHGSSFLG